MSNGKVRGLCRTYLPNYNEFYEARHFTRGMEETVQVISEKVVNGQKLLFTCLELPELKIAAELCEDLWTMEPPSIGHAMHGATLMLSNLSASDETTGKPAYREELVGGQSLQDCCAAIFMRVPEMGIHTGCRLLGQYDHRKWKDFKKKANFCEWKRYPRRSMCPVLRPSAAE